MKKSLLFVVAAVASQTALAAHAASADAYSRVSVSYENVPAAGQLAGQVVAARIAELTPPSDAAKTLPVVFRLDPSLTGECARVTVSAGRAEIAGARVRSLYYGAGRLLSRVSYGEKTFGLADGTDEICPAKPLRIAYWARHFHNWYHVASAAELKRYAEDMMLIGCNGFHFMFAYPTMNRAHAGAAEVEAYVRKSRAVYDHVKAMDAAFSEEGGGNQLPSDSPRWLQAGGALGDVEQFNGCPSIPGALDYMLGYRRTCLGELKGVRPDWFRAWPYDEGGCKCEKCAPWGGNGYLRLAKRQAEVNKAYAPEARTMVSTWLFKDHEYQALWEYLAKPESAWIDALIIDAHKDFPKYPLTHKLPRDIPVVTFPEISMWGRYPWGGYGAIAMPERFERLFRQVEHLASGFEFYSEGLFEDLNKFVVAGLYMDPTRHARELVCDYARRYFPGADPNRFADFVSILESTQEMPGTCWKYDLFAQSEEALRAFARKTAAAAALARELEETLLPTARRTWRWRLFALRAASDDILQRTRDWFAPELAPIYDEIRRISHSVKSVMTLSNDTGHHALSPIDPDIKLKGRSGEALSFRARIRNSREEPLTVNAAFEGNAGIVFRRGGFVGSDGTVAWGGERTLAPGEDVTLAGEIAVGAEAEPGRLYRCRVSRLWLGLQVVRDRPPVRMEGDAVAIENARFRLEVGTNAVVRSLVVKATGEELVDPGAAVPLATVTQARPYNNEIKLIHPHRRTTYPANRVRCAGDRLVFGFEIAPYEAEVSVRLTDSYAVFTLERFIVKPLDYDYLKMDVPPAREFRVLQLPIQDRKYFGNWLNCAWDETNAVAVVGTALETFIGNERCAKGRLLTADLRHGYRLQGGSAGLIVANGRDDFLGAMEAFEKDLDLPRGVESRRNPLVNASILHSGWDLSPTNAAEYAAFAKEGGFRLFTFGFGTVVEETGCWPLNGNYDYRASYPEGDASLAKTIAAFTKQGIVCGFHFLHPHIGLQSRYVTPVADARLAVKRRFTLVNPLPAGASTNATFDLAVHEPTEGTALFKGTRILKFGGELIAYESYTTERPFVFRGCRRGWLGTRVVAHPAGEVGGLLDVSEFGGDPGCCHIDQTTDLQDEIADKLARFWNCGFRYAYFDGSEAVQEPFDYHVANAQYRVWKKFNPRPIFSEAAAKSHFGWHILSGANAFDGFKPEEFKEKLAAFPCAQAALTWQDMTRVNFGWWYLDPPNEKTVGTQVDMWEYGCSKSLAWDCPATCTLDLGRIRSHPRTKDIFRAMRRWEKARAEKRFTAAEKEMFRDTRREFHLYPDGKGGETLVEWTQLDVAGGKWTDVRAFLFELNGKRVVAYWHVRGKGTLELGSPYGTLAADDLKYWITDLPSDEVRALFSRAEVKLESVARGAMGSEHVDVKRLEAIFETGWDGRTPYACGTPLAPRLRFQLDGRPVALSDVKLAVDDWVTPRATEKTDVPEGGVTFAAATLDRPGFLRFTATVGKKKYMRSVPFETDRLVKGSPLPSDFMAYWRGEIAKMEADGRDEPTLMPVTGYGPAFDAWRVRFATVRGKSVYGVLTVPKNRSKGPFPVRFEIPSAGQPTPTYPASWIYSHRPEPNAVSMTIFVHCAEIDVKEVRDAYFERIRREHKEKYGVGYYPLAGISDGREAYHFHPVFLGAVRAVKWLHSQPYVDTSRFTYQGSSQGGYFGFVLAGLTPYFTKVVAIVPAGTDTMGYLAGRCSGWPRLVEAQRAENKAAAEKWAPYFDAANFALSVTAPIRVVCGCIDTTCPPTCVTAAFNALSSKDKTLVFMPEHGHATDLAAVQAAERWRRE